MMNLTDQKRRVKKGTKIAKCEPVESVLQSREEVDKSALEVMDLPDHLKELYKRSLNGLTSG